MKKKCMAVGGTAKKPATMTEQLAGIRGKVRPGYQAGGIAGIDYQQSFSGQFPTRQPLGSNLGATAIQSGEYAVNAPGSTPQSLGLLGQPDYSTGPRQVGFVNEDGTPRQMNQTGSPTVDRGPLSGQIDMGKAMAGLSNTERYKLGGSGTAAEASAINERNDILKTMNAQLAPTQQVQLNRAPRAGISAAGIPSVQSMATAAQIPQIGQGTSPRRNRQGFSEGGIIDKLIRTVGRVLPDSNGQKYEPGIQSRAAEDPARHGRAEALNPRTQTASSETPPAGGFQEEAERRRKQMKEAMSYEDGGMVESKDEDESEDKNKCSIEISIDIPIGDKKVKAKNSDAADYACGGKVKKRGMAGGGMVRFSGKGGPRDDQIPVKVAGEEINVSDGENAVILPAKTAANPAALYAIGGIIQATNDGRRPKMGMESGGKYARGGIVGGNLSSSGAYVNEDDISGVENLKRAMATYAKPFQAVGQVFADSARAQQEGVSYQDIQQRKPVQQAAPYSNEGRPSAMDNYALTPVGQTGQGITSGVAQPSGAVVKDGMTTTQMGAGFDPTKLQMADGYGMATNAAGKTVAAGNTEYVGADGKPTSRWTDTQQYKDAIARNEADKLRLAEMQAQRLGADPMAVQKASQGIAQSVMQAPLDARVKQQQIQQGDIAAQNANELRALYEAHKAAKTPEERSMYEDAIRVRTGKDKPEEFAHAAGGTTINPTTMGVEKTPDVIYSKRTGKPAGESQAAKPYSVSVGMPVQAGDGVHTFQGKQITVKAGKVTEVK